MKLVTPQREIKALVTGGAGFIGSHLVDRLIHDGIQVVVVDNLQTGRRSNLNRRADLVEKDVRDYEAKERFDYIFHLSANPDLNYSIGNPISTTENNLLDTVHILEIARKYEARVIFSSSCAVYGSPIDHKWSESTPTIPETPYGLQKLQSEEWLRLYRRMYGVRSASLRYFNVYGDRMPVTGSYGSVLAKFIKAYATGEPMTIYGDGQQTRSYIHVSDVVEANIKAMGWEGEFNIGTEEETSVEQLARWIGGEVEYISNPRENDVEKVRADISKARERGWMPNVGIRVGIDLLKGIVDNVDK